MRNRQLFAIFVMEMFEDFTDYIEAERRYSPLTVHNYRRDMEKFAAWCCERASLPIEEFAPERIDTDDVRQWILHRMEHDKIKPASMNRELSSLKSYYRFLRKRGVVNNDIFKRISSLKTPHKLPTFVPETRMETVLENVREQSESQDLRQQRNALIVALLYSCGIRLAELCGIRTTDFSDDFATLKVRGKGDKERIIPILHEVTRRITDYIDRLHREGIISGDDFPLIFTEQSIRNGKPISRSSVQRIVEQELQAANVHGRKSPHVLRHTFATHLLNRNADMRDIQELMGHSSLTTTQNYTHNSITQLQSVYAKAHPHNRARNDK